jgi:hypothetical protein
MSDSNTKKTTNEEIKEYLIAISKDITELNKGLIEDIESGKKLGFYAHQLVVFGFNIDRITARKHVNIANQFTKHISELLQKN